MRRFLRPLISLILFTSLWSLSAVAAKAPAKAAVGKQVIDRTAVTVNNEVLLESDIEKFRNKMKSKSYQELFGGVDPSLLTSREAVLQLMVEEKLINQQVKKLELSATDQEIDAQIRSIVKRNGISLPQLTERIKQLGSTMGDYREAIKRQIERKNLVDREIKPTLEVSDEQLRHFYMRQQNPGDAETTFRIAHILIEPKKDLKDAQARANKVWQEASKKPADFPRLVAEYSDDTSTIETEGLLGDFSISQMAKEFRETVPKIAVGQVTKPVQTAAGFHIIKVLEKKAGDFSTLAKDKKEQLRNMFVAEELEKKMALWLERKKNESHIRVIKNADK